MKTAEQAYLKMIQAENNQTPVIITADKTNIILGYLNNKFYRIKTNDKNSTFYTVHENKLEPMDVNSFQNIIVSIDEQLNRNGQFDNLLTYIVSAYGEFKNNSEAINKNTLRERVAIGKNILIQKGILTTENTL